MDKKNTENPEKQSAPATTDEVMQKAYQAVALSATIAIQDAVDNLRSMNTVCTTIIGVAMSQALETPEYAEDMQKIIEMAQKITEHAARNCERVNLNATALLDKFPRG